MTSENFNKWFDTFLEEKELPYAAWEIETADNVHMIDSDFVVEAIKSAPVHEQAKIKNTIVKIDFCNGDVNHFFEHLANALVANY